VTSHTPGTAVGSGRDGQPVPRPLLTKRLRPGDWLAIDCVVAVLLAVVSLVGSTRPAYHIPVSVAYAFALVSTLPVAVRRLWPLPVLGVVLAGSVAAMTIGTGKEPSAAVALVLYLVGLRYPRRMSAAVLVAVLAATAAGTVAGGAALGYSEAGNVAARVAGEAVFLAASWAIGVAVREQRAYTAGLREQAERQVQAQLAEARRTVAEERLRIAREMHDVVAHSLSLIALQAGVGHYVAAVRPEEAARTLASIETASRAAMGEMRRLLGVLRDDRAGTDLAPAPGLADVGQLITGTGDAGVQIQLEIRGTQRPVPPGVDLAAYRIIQEALTNVVKHAQTTAGRVIVTYTDDALCLEITDDGHGAPAAAVTASAGHGLAGMAERVSLFGGEFCAGPLPGRGFRVAARLPLDRGPGEAAG
jgi:signal transduction histidine kinase